MKPKKQHPYKRIKYDKDVVELAYQRHIKFWKGLSEEERRERNLIKPNPRRLFIFLRKYEIELSRTGLMDQETRDKYVLSWVAMPRSAKKKMSKKYLSLWLSVKSMALSNAKQRLEIWRMKLRDPEIDGFTKKVIIEKILYNNDII